MHVFLPVIVRISINTLLLQFKLFNITRATTCWLPGRRALLLRCSRPAASLWRFNARSVTRIVVHFSAPLSSREPAWHLSLLNKSMFDVHSCLTSTAFASVIIVFFWAKKSCNTASFQWCIARITCCYSIYRRRRLLSTRRFISRRSAGIWVTRLLQCVSSVATSSSLLVN